MRVLWISPELPRPGRPGSMAPAARQLASLQSLGVEFQVIDMRGLPMAKYALAIPRVRRLAKGVDLVHAHFGYCGWLAQTQFRVPTVVSFMGDDLLGTPTASGQLHWLSRQMVAANRRLARRVAAVIVKSPEMANVLAPGHCQVIPNGVDTDVFRPLDKHEARQRLNWKPDRHYVLFPGDPANPRKGFTLADAATRIAMTRVDRPIELIPMWGVAPDDVAVTMNACDAMWMTSQIEGSPNVVKEAMACDLPVIATPVGDVAELLHGVDGCKVVARDPETLGRSLADVLRQGAKSAGRAALLAGGLDLRSVAYRVLKVYEDTLGQAHVDRQSHGSTRRSSGSSSNDGSLAASQVSAATPQTIAQPRA